jgi:hypothetical protein
MKKISMKIEKLEIIKAGLENLVQLEIKAKTSWNITRIAKKITKELELVDKERVKLCEKYCDKDENGNSVLVDNKYIFSGDGEENLNKEFFELRQQEIEIEVALINIDDLPEVKPWILMVLEDLIEE